MAETRILSHPFPPVYDSKSEILILGSFPSVKSVEAGYYYANPRNRFYAVMSELFNDDFIHTSWDNKRLLLLKHHVALYDVIKTIAIRGSSDAKILRAEPSLLKEIFEKAPIRAVYCNGGKAYQLYCRYFSEVSIPIFLLPSTSPANAKMDQSQLVTAWSKIFHQ